TSYTPAWSEYGVDVAVHEYSSSGFGNVPFATESGSDCKSASYKRFMKSRRAVASASASRARRARSAVRKSLPAADNAPTVVMPTIATAATASSSEMPRRAASRVARWRMWSARFDMRLPTPCIDADPQRMITAAAHDDCVGERGARRAKDVLQPRRIGDERLRWIELELPCRHLPR